MASGYGWVVEDTAGGRSMWWMEIAGQELEGAHLAEAEVEGLPGQLSLVELDATAN